MPVSWYDGLARILTKIEDSGVWPDGLLDAYIAMIPKVDGDAAPLGQRPLSVLPVVYRIWASARMVSLMAGFGLGCLILSSVLGVVVGRWKHGNFLLLILSKFLLVPMILIFISLSQIWSSLLIRLIGVSWIVSCVVLGFLAGFVMLILSIMLMSGCGLSWRLALASPGLVMAVFLRVVL